MKNDRRKTGDPGFEQYQDDINWTAGVGRPAGIFWFGDRCVMAAHGTAAEERLLEQGAVLLRTLRFDADPLETLQRSGQVARIGAAQVFSEFLLSGTS